METTEAPATRPQRPADADRAATAVDRAEPEGPATAVGSRPARPEKPLGRASRAARHWALLPPVLLLVLGSVLLLRRQGLWYDELYTAAVLRLPFSDVVGAAVAGHGPTPYLSHVPPSYNAPFYVLMRVWVALPFPDGDLGLRAPSLLAAAGGVGLLVRAVIRWAGLAGGLAAGLAVAANPLLLEHAVEARGYGLVVLATGAAALGLARWLDSAPGGLALLGLAGAGMGLAHWYAVPVLGGMVLAGILLRPRASPALLAVGAAAVAPAATLVAMNLLNGNGDRNAMHILDTDGRLWMLAVGVWVGDGRLLPVVTLSLAAISVVRLPRVGVIGAAWLLVPLLMITAAELVRPVYVPRYLLPALLGLAVLAGAGAVAWSRRVVAIPLAALLVGGTLYAALPVLERPPRERSDDLVAFLDQRQGPGEPVVASDPRAGVGLEHYARGRLRDDLIFPPADAPPGADRVWLVRSLKDGALRPSDDDDLLARDGLRVLERVRFAGSSTTLVVQRWERTRPPPPAEPR